MFVVAVEISQGMGVAPTRHWRTWLPPTPNGVLGFRAEHIPQRMVEKSHLTFRK